MSHEDLYARNERLEAKLAEAPIDRQVHLLAMSGRTNRRLARIAIFGLCLDMALSLFLGYMFTRVDKNSQSITAACMQSNAENAKAVQFWQTITDLSTASQTPAQRAQTAAVLPKFQKVLQQTYPQRDCNE